MFIIVLRYHVAITIFLTQLEWSSAPPPPNVSTTLKTLQTLNYVVLVSRLILDKSLDGKWEFCGLSFQSVLYEFCCGERHKSQKLAYTTAVSREPVGKRSV